GCARQERDAPPECEELIVGEPTRECEERTPRKQKPDWCPELRKHPVPRPLSGRCVFNRQENGAAPLAAEAETLTEAAQREQARCGDPDGFVRRQDANGDRRDTHREECGDERRLAADAIAEVPEERGSDRPRHERDAERRERRERGR